MSGGDSIEVLRMDRPGWREAFASLPASGRMAEIEWNLAVLCVIDIEHR